MTTTDALPALPEGVTISSEGGNCPVQIEGTIDGIAYYFRARGSRWSVGIGGEPVAAPEWRWEDSYGPDVFAAGWMTLSEARGFLFGALARWRAGEAGQALDAEPLDLDLARSLEPYFATLENDPEHGGRISELRALLERHRGGA